MDNSCCKSENLIYIIQCKLCSFFYIGQTKNLHQRIYTHIYKIKNFKPYKDNACTAIHFNYKPHNFEFNFNFYVFKTGINDLDDRLNLERELIHLFLKLNDVKIMNIKIPMITDHQTSK